MKLDRVALVVALVALVLAIYPLSFVKPSTTGVGHTSAPAEALIVLDDSGGTCHVTYKTERVYANRGQIIHWQINNNCGSDQTVSLADFTNGDPLDTAPHVRTVPARDSRPLVAVVKVAAAYGTFPYAIYLGQTKQTDPDIVIEF